jgi:hypothetical protein
MRHGTVYYGVSLQDINGELVLVTWGHEARVLRGHVEIEFHRYFHNFGAIDVGICSCWYIQSTKVRHTVVVHSNFVMDV